MWTWYNAVTRENMLLGVDPGRSKSGLALVSEDGSLEKFTVAMMNNFAAELQDFVQDRQVQTIVVGNGTTSVAMQQILKDAFPTAAVQVVEESHSTEDARKLYWQLYPPKGLKKLIPLGLQVPPINLDGLAAVILVRRYLGVK